MAKYYYKDDNGKNHFIKDIDFAQCKLTFTDDFSEAYNGRDGYYEKPLRDQIRRLFVDDCPEAAKVEVYYY